MANAKTDGVAKLKILCLHGYRQNAQTFRERTGAFRKIIKSRADLVFVTAPNRVPPLPSEEGDTPQDKQDDQTGWWFSRDDDYYMAQDYTDCCKGYKESLEVIAQAFRDQGPFDGVLAFSQGAALLSLICALMERDSDPSPFQFDFAILVAGFRSRQVSHKDLYCTKVTIPTLHVYGETDKVIQKEMSEALLDCYTDPVILQHGGGHFIPASGPQKKVYTQFLDTMLERKRQKATS